MSDLMEKTAIRIKCGNNFFEIKNYIKVWQHRQLVLNGQKTVRNKHF